MPGESIVVKITAEGNYYETIKKPPGGAVRKSYGDSGAIM